MEENLVFQKGNKKDVHRIYELFLKGIEEMTENGINQWDEVYPNINDIENDLDKEELFVGMSGNEIAVVYVLNKEYDEQYHNGNWSLATENFKVIHRLCVHPKFQNRGFGKKTLLYIEEVLRQQGIRAIRLDAFSQNPYALKMYNSLGYTAVGEAFWRKGKFFLMEKVIEAKGAL